MSPETLRQVTEMHAHILNESLYGAICKGVLDESPLVDSIPSLLILRTCNKNMCSNSIKENDRSSND